jgi:sugar lactone lactonase YvrE
MPRSITTLVDGIAFGEGPRWHDGALYLSDIHADRVLRVNPGGGYDVVAHFEGPTSGLGWLPDGRMLVVSMIDRRVLRREPDGRFVVHAELADIATWHANDMVVAANGTAYVGNFGFPIHPPGTPCTAAIARIAPDGTTSVAAEEFWFPNGMVITPDGATMIVAESGTRILTALAIAADGSLVDRRLWSALPQGALPDGICLDADGAIWVASPASHEVLRMREGGDVLDRIPTEQEAVACILGGVDGRTLFMLTADRSDPVWCRSNHSARILSTQVDVPGAGFP